MMNRLVARMRSLDQLRFSWLDFKVGFCMLARYPGLTLVGTVAIAVAIALGTIYFEAVNKWQNPRLPIRDGDRVIAILSWDVYAVAPEGRSLHDWAIWREQVKTDDRHTRDRAAHEHAGTGLSRLLFRLRHFGGCRS